MKLTGMWSDSHSLQLAIGNDVNLAIYACSHATSKFYNALKALYKPQGAVAKFYVRHKYENVKLSNHDDFDSFMTAMINAAYQFNKELSDASGHIKKHDIAMRILHAVSETMLCL